MLLLYHSTFYSALILLRHGPELRLIHFIKSLKLTILLHKILSLGR